MDLIPGEVVDRYEIETVLGEGGMARVFRARHTGLGTLHAVKLLTTATPHIRDRLVQEGRVQASLKHANIVAVHDIIEVDGAPGLVMEYVDGPTLSALLVRGHRLSEAQLDALVLPILDAVEHAHAVHVVHRDLKPANVLLAREGRELVPKVTDFGLAKLLSTDRKDSATRSGVAMGTPAYMAPEQIRDAKNVGPESDLWSLGAILFELCTGTRAFAGDDVFEIYRCVVEGDRVPVRDLAPDVPERMVRTIDAALVVDRYERAATVAALRALWTEGMPAQEGAPWDAGELERIGGLGHGGKPWSVTDGGTSGAGRRATGPSGSEETLVLNDTLPESVLSDSAAPPAPHVGAATLPSALPPMPSQEGEPPRTGGRWPWLVLGAAGLAVGLGGLGWGLRPATEVPPPAPTAAPVPTTQPTPEPTSPEPRVPIPEPRPTPPEPVPSAPQPRPAAPEPRPAPPEPVPSAPQPKPTPPEPAPSAPQPEPAAPQPAAATTSVVVTGYSRVELAHEATGRTQPPGEVEPGTWRVVAVFGSTPTRSEPFDVAEGQTVTVVCAESMGKCQVK